MKWTIPFRLIALSLTAIALGANDSRASGRSFGRLRAFTADGCSRVPDGTLTEPRLWRHCCIEHDLSYWAGGTRDERRQADLELRACVAATGHPDTAELMFAGVRVGGTPFVPTSFRWGYGWPKLRGYAPLSLDERREVRALAPRGP